jgi:hypothetical protein
MARLRCSSTSPDMGQVSLEQNDVNRAHDYCNNDPSSLDQFSLMEVRGYAVDN